MGDLLNIIRYYIAKIVDPFQSELPNTGEDPVLPKRQFPPAESMIVHEPTRPEVPERPQHKIPEEEEVAKSTIAPLFETWYHGALPRKQVTSYHCLSHITTPLFWLETWYHGSLPRKQVPYIIIKVIKLRLCSGYKVLYSYHHKDAGNSNLTNNYKTSCIILQVRAGTYTVKPV